MPPGEETQINDTTETTPNETVDEETTNDPTEETTDETTSEEAEIDTKEELKVSQQDYDLIQLLKNPGTRKQALSAIAESVGVKFATGEVTKTEAKKTSLQILKESLGDDWGFLAEKLEPALNTIVGERLGELKQEFASAQEKQVLRESEEATAGMYKKFPDFKSYEGEILRAMDKFQPSSDMTPADFLEHLYYMVKGKRGQGSLAKQIANRVSKNSRDTEIVSRGAPTESSLRTGSKRPTLDEAVKRAVNQLNKEK